MASERDKADNDQKPAAGSTPKTEAKPAAKGQELNDEVARVVNLLERLEQMHAKPSQTQGAAAGPAGKKLGDGAADKPSLSALSERRVERLGPRLVSRLDEETTGSATRADIPSQPSLGPDPEFDAFAGSALSKVDKAHSTAKTPPQPRESGAEASEPPRPSKARLALLLLVLAASVTAGISFLILAPNNKAVTFKDLAPRVPLPPGEAPLATQPNAAVRSPAVSTRPSELASPCGAQLTANPLGTMTLDLSDPARANQPLIIKVQDLAYDAAFNARGALSLTAPLLSQTNFIRWSLPDGTACTRIASLANVPGMMTIALVWSGSIPLDLQVIEPNAWFNAPSGYVSSTSPNQDHQRGLGELLTFSSPSREAGAQVQAYRVELAKLPFGATLSAFVKPASPNQKPAGSQPAFDATVTSARPAQPACTSEDGGKTVQVPYQVHIVRTGPEFGDNDRDVQSFEMAVNPCDGSAADRSERIIVRN